jgi:alpha-L-fucosidase
MKKIDYRNLEQGIRDVDAVIAQGPYHDDWDSLGMFEAPAWFCGAKFGIFIHWGVFSVPAYSNEWYPRNMYIKGMPAYEQHIKTYGPQKDFGYKDFIPRYTMERFNPAEWAALFKEAGARYVFPLAEHHDGFQMYQSVISHFNAAEMGPKRDLLGDLKNALEDAGLVFCTSSHRAEHWFFLGHGKEFDSDVKEPLVRGDLYWPSMAEPDNQDLYGEPRPTTEYLQDWLLRTCEIIDRYQPRVIYFDWWVQHVAFRPYFKKFAAYYHNRGREWGKDVAICYKHDGMMFGAGIVEVERGKFADCKPYKWQADTPVAKNSWCYVQDIDYKKSVDIIRELIDVVSKNGNMLLNVGPKSDGTIPEGDERILRDIGAWLAVNGEGIYDSKVWRVSAEGPTIEAEGQFQDNAEKSYTAEDFRFTVKGGAIYVFALNYPANGHIRIRSLSNSPDPNKPGFHGVITNVSILGFAEKPVWAVSDEGLSVTAKTAPGPFPVTIKVEVL